MTRTLALTALLLPAVACQPAVDLEEERAAIRATWDRGSRALEAGDWKTYSDFWAHTPYVQILHPNQAEWLTGWDRIGPSYRAFLAEGPEITSRTREMRIRVSPSGEMAWATLKADVSFGGGEDGATVTLWETAVFEKVAGEWKLVHGHASQPAVRDREGGG